MSPEVRDLVNRVEAIGWKCGGYDGRGHVVLIHDNGERANIPATPSDYRSLLNVQLMLERIGGRKLPRVKRGRSRKNFAAPKVDPAIEAARRRHAQTYDEKCERIAQAEAEAKRAEAAAQRAADDDRRRREIEKLMQP